MSIALCRPSLILRRPERQLDTIFIRAVFPEHLQPSNDTASSSLLASDAARQVQWSNIAGGTPNIAHEALRASLTEGTTNVTYDSMDDNDRCEWHFLFSAFPRDRSVKVVDRDSCRAWLTIPGTSDRCTAHERPPAISG